MLWEQALVDVHGLDWRGALVTEAGRLDWRKASREFAREWRVKAKVSLCVPCGSGGTEAEDVRPLRSPRPSSGGTCWTIVCPCPGLSSSS